MNAAMIRGLVFLEATAAQLLRWKFFVPVLITFVVTYPSHLAAVAWVNKAAFLTLFLFFMLWLVNRWQQRLRMGPIR